MLTGTETALLVALLLGGGATVGLVMTTLRDDRSHPVAGRPVQDASVPIPLGLDEQSAQFLVNLGETMVFEPIGQRDRDQPERQHQ